LFCVNSPMTHDSEGKTIVRLITAAIEDIAYHPQPDRKQQAAPAAAPCDSPTIAEASALWTLNGEQHAAFIPVACALLNTRLQRLLFASDQGKPEEKLSEDQVRALYHARAFLRRIVHPKKSNEQMSDDDCLPESEKENPHLMMLVLGGGGTGKSRLIQCIRDFARRWGLADTMRVCATTGSAAANVQGSTWQSTTGVGVRHKSRSKDESALRDVMSARPVDKELLGVWSPVSMMILDEVSMAGCQSVGRLDERLQQLKEQPNVPFGGVHMVFLGDLAQLKPVFETVLYNVPNGNNNQLRVGMLGHKRWTELEVGVELTVNKRAEESPRWVNILEQYRPNAPRQSDIEAVKSRFLNERNAASLRPPPGSVGPLWLLVYICVTACACSRHDDSGRQ
jgi:hypothetical protein